MYNRYHQGFLASLKGSIWNSRQRKMGHTPKTLDGSWCFTDIVHFCIHKKMVSYSAGSSFLKVLHGTSSKREHVCCRVLHRTLKSCYDFRFNFVLRWGSLLYSSSRVLWMVNSSGLSTRVLLGTVQQGNILCLSTKCSLAL